MAKYLLARRYELHAVTSIDSGGACVWAEVGDRLQAPRSQNDDAKVDLATAKEMIALAVRVMRRSMRWIASGHCNHAFLTVRVGVSDS